ncbi:MAG TPA: GFA family protein [Rhodobacterales bacterium]|nr:GFA family protein [Rhodobacterales bacterium]
MPKGRCECGAVAFQIDGDLKPPTACHCSQCRRLSGHIWAGAWANTADIRFSRDDGLKWYSSSDWAERGFCKECGSSLFYRLKGEDHRMSVAVGCLDNPTGLTLGRHIYVKDKGDYYEISDDLPQLETY